MNEKNFLLFSDYLERDSDDPDGWITIVRRDNFGVKDSRFTLDFMRNRFRPRIITNKFASFRSIMHKVYSVQWPA